MTVPTDLDARFRAAAADAGLLDVATATHDTPIGTLFLAVSGGGAKARVEVGGDGHACSSFRRRRRTPEDAAWRAASALEPSAAPMSA